MIGIPSGCEIRAFPAIEQSRHWRASIPGQSPPMEGWICPALFRYYDAAPPELYVKADPLPAE